jgi:cobalt-zinc-cadmium efflux system outer membrane protein
VDVREAEARVDVAEAKIDRAEREGRFDVTLFGNYTRMDAGFPQQAFNPAGSLERIRAVFHYVTAGASFTLPLLNRNQGEVAAAQAALGAAEASRDAARLSAEAELAAARTRDEYAHRAAMSYGSGAHRLSAQNLAVVRQSYDLGRLTVFDVLAEQRRYLDIERDFTEVLRSAYEARTALKRARGVVQ